MKKFTSGPWELGHQEHHPWGLTVEVSTSDDDIGVVDCYEGDMSNARLITAAPELYEVLYDIIEALEVNEVVNYFPSLYQRALDVIGKVEK